MLDLSGDLIVDKESEMRTVIDPAIVETSRRLP
jgi:hypothetical protein